MKIRQKLLSFFGACILVFVVVIMGILSSAQNMLILHGHSELSISVLSTWNRFTFQTLRLRVEKRLNVNFQQEWLPTKERLEEQLSRLFALTNAGYSEQISETLQKTEEFWKILLRDIENIERFLKVEGSVEVIKETDFTAVDVLHRDYMNDPARSSQWSELDRFVGYLRTMELSAETFNGLLNDVPDMMQDEVQRIEARQQVSILAGLVISISGILVFVYLFTKRLSNRLVVIEKTMDMVSRKDLTVQADVRVKDETGDLAAHVNEVIGSLKNIISDIKDTARHTLALRDELGASTSQSSAAMTQIAANIQNIERQFHNLDQEISNVFSSVESINRKLETQTQGMGRQSSAAVESSSAIEEMAASINSVSRLAADRMSGVEGLVDITNRGSEVMTQTSSVIQEIAREIENLLDIIDIINTIANQTDLLSMNAAIESAHAGDAGRGFAVVAEEIRKLAESTGENSKMVSSSLNQITERIKNAAETSRESLVTFGQINQEVKNTAQAFKEISKAMEEMAAGTSEIISGTEEVKNVSSEILVEVRSIQTESETITGALENVQRLSGSVLNGIQEINVGGQEVIRAMNSLNEVGDRARESMQHLGEKVTGFVTE
ncbi:MAG: HAMP domain-containing protein [Spirochaetales bacterium]|nr:HAMP domain-containing protein [Spirochaetales bacterium]